MWNEKGRKIFKEKLEKMEIEGKKIEEKWGEMEKKLKEALETTEKEVRKKNTKKGGGTGNAGHYSKKRR